MARASPIEPSPEIFPETVPEPIADPIPEPVFATEATSTWPADATSTEIGLFETVATTTIETPFVTVTTTTFDFVTSTLTFVTSTPDLFETTTTTLTTLKMLSATTTVALLETTSTEATLELATSTTDVLIVTSTLELPPAEPPVILLRELNPYPLDGPETIDLLLWYTTDTNFLAGWTLADLQGTIFRFTSTTPVEVTSDALHIHATLSSNRLNNSGDTVMLRDAEDRLMESVTYVRVQKGQRWSRGAFCDEEWHLADEFGVRIEEEVVEPTVAEPTVTTPHSINETGPIILIHPTTTHTTTTSATAPPRQKTTTQAKTSAQAVIAQTTTVEQANSTTTVREKKTMDQPSVRTKKINEQKKVTPPKKKTITATKKTSVKVVVSKEPATVRTSIDRLPSLMDPTNPSPVRVLLRGQVITPPRLLSTNQFVLANPDGRSLLVHGTNKQPTPPFNATVEITGSLTLNDQGLQLTMAAKDRWRVVASLLPQEAMPRTVDLLTPDLEDAWSLVDVTGTITEVKGMLVHLDVNETEIGLRIKPLTGYRAARLLKGDVVRVRGVIDTRGDEMIVYPRAVDDILLIRHAIATPTPTPANTVPPWTPLAAAGLTVALGQGWKRIGKMREQRRLERMLAEANKALVQQGEE
ncbi:MAG: lamin tail domain-containing protein [Patescibacteria group bacterium]